jgi:hypothetical protein
MHRPSLRHVLSSALLAALASPLSACGAVVQTTPDDGGVDAVGDAAPDSIDDTMNEDDTGTPDTFVPIDGGTCPEPTLVDTSTCNESVTYPCGLPITLAGATPTTKECEVLCDPVTKATGRTAPPFGCWVSTDDASPGVRVGCASCAVGRRPADLRDEPAEHGDPVGIALADMARIEAASVHAFRRLEKVLSELDAPASLRARARSAARDEIRHARIVSRIARARGAKHRRILVDREAVPTTYALALENAVEGCVKETLGVAYLAHQASHAEDPELRTMAASLYEDELAHATLSWDLVAFFDAHLDEAQRATLRAAQTRALEEVVEEASSLHHDVRKAFGIPSGEIVARMVEGLRTTLYA